MSAISTLKVAPVPPCAEIVACLRELLERAERGEILAFAGVVQMTGHEVASVTVRGEGSSIFTLLGAAHELAYRICREEIEQR